MEPLASKLRPKTLEDFVGQAHLLGSGQPLRQAIEQGTIFSFILWGPPGVGKTTLARIYAAAINAETHELSAVSASKDDIRQIVAGQPTLRPVLLFLDEIHRFTKAQQDFLLPYVESGRLVLVGATTENPSFEVIPALLSRMRVFTLRAHESADLAQIVARANISITDEAREWLIDYADGDARQVLTILDNAIQLYGGNGNNTASSTPLSLEKIQALTQKKYLRYDKNGEEHHNIISAFIKSMRASQPDAALYYLARMLEAGEDPKFIARRMVVFASEDIGMAQPTALVVANEVFRAVETIGLPECGINLAHGTVYLATAPKNRSSYYGFRAAQTDVHATGNLPIPMIVRNAPTKLMQDEGYGEGYEMYSNEDFLPDKLRGKKYYQK